MENYSDRFIAACARVDWTQALLNGDGPCFHVEADGRLCGRAMRWAGHQAESADHLYVPLHVGVSMALRGEAARAAKRMPPGVVAKLEPAERVVAGFANMDKDVVTVPEGDVWECKIGFAGQLPYGADGPMREAVLRAFIGLTGRDPAFCFSGWGGNLTTSERQVIRMQDVLLSPEDRLSHEEADASRLKPPYDLSHRDDDPDRVGH